MLAPSGGGPGSSAGAAPSRDTVQNRSAAPATKAVTSRIARAFPGVQSIHSGATISSAARSPSAPTMVQRRSSGPSCEVSDVSGPRSTAPNSSVARIRTPKTVATANAAPRYPPPKACSATDLLEDEEHQHEEGEDVTDPAHELCAPQPFHLRSAQQGADGTLAGVRDKGVVGGLWGGRGLLGSRHAFSLSARGRTPGPTRPDMHTSRHGTMPGRSHSERRAVEPGVRRRRVHCPAGR